MNDHFFIAGAQRSGTSYLYLMLAEHPEIEMAEPSFPEPKFFLLDRLFDLGKDYYEKNYFTGKKHAWLRGEKSVSYMETEKSAERISRFYPDAKIIFLLRDPVKRAISNYLFSVSNGLETFSMEEAFYNEADRVGRYDRDKVSVSPFAYLSRGRYVDFISMYEKYFPRENLYILLLEDLISDRSVLKDLFRFLRVSLDFFPQSWGKTVNPGDKGDHELNKELENYLVGYFAEPNASLSERYGISFSAWT